MNHRLTMGGRSRGVRRFFSVIAVGILVCLTESTVCSARFRRTEWQTHKTRHFIIYHKGVAKDFLNEVEEAAEGYYRSIASALGFTRYKGWTFKNRAEIYIYEDKDDYVRSSGAVGWSHGKADTRRKIIRTYPAAHGFFDTILPHELGHIIFREFVGYQAPVPLWFEEGVAMMQERARRFGANQQVRQAMRESRDLTVEDLNTLLLTRQVSDDTVKLFYSSSASLVRFLIEKYGHQRFVRLCRKLRDGDRFEAAFFKVYPFKNWNQVQRAWEDHLQRKAR